MRPVLVVVRGLGAAMATLLFALLLASLLPGAWRVPVQLTMGLLVVVLALWGVALWGILQFSPMSEKDSNRWHRKDPKFAYRQYEPVLKSHGRHTVTILRLAIYGVWAVAMISIAHLMGGAPERVGDTYVLNNHGTTTSVSLAEYHAGLVWQNRFFQAILLAFCLVIPFIADAAIHFMDREDLSGDASSDGGRAAEHRT